MQTECERHFDDDILELYSIGRLRDEQVPAVEEHLLLCSECQLRFTSIDDYVRAAKSATAELEREKATPKREFGELLRRLWLVPKPLWAAGMATACLAVSLIVLSPWQVQNGHETELRLTAARGQDTLTPHASSRENLLLTIDATRIPPAPAYVLQLVNASGAEVWKADVKAQGTQITAKVPKRRAGTYWVRLYNPRDTETPLQEYGLVIE
ncbi:MAG: hypothetical protein M3Z32_04360 [Acidobacteriota bacterium]|nr:hypothetical protein [Acidobacteriota bacterium]